MPRRMLRGDLKFCLDDSENEGIMRCLAQRFESPQETLCKRQDLMP
jgi:hypothetical protein